jgi:predicted phage terminase large subunit-like protein
VWRWWQTDIRGRLKPHGGACVIIMSRWHEDDLVGRLLAAQEVGEEAGTGLEAFRWKVLHLPALAEPTGDVPDPLGRAPGEALWPEWFSAEHLRGLRDDPLGAGRLAFEAQYQGRPTTPEGGMFRVDAWNYVGALHHEVLLEARAGAVWVRRWDLAGTEERGGNDPDWTAGVLMARTRDGRTFVVDARRIRAEPLGVQRFIRKTFEEDRERWGATSVRMAIDPGAGRYAFSEFSRLVLPDADFGGKRESGAKDVRARPWAAQVEQGNVFLLGDPRETPWIRDYVEEHRSFPHGAHDDWVDASALAYLDLAGGAGLGDGTPFVSRSRYRR